MHANTETTALMTKTADHIQRVKDHARLSHASPADLAELHDALNHVDQIIGRIMHGSPAPSHAPAASAVHAAAPPSHEPEGATDEQVGDRTGPGAGYDDEPVQVKDKGGVSS